MRVGEIWYQKWRPEDEVVITKIIYCKIQRWTWTDEHGKEHMGERLLNDYLVFLNKPNSAIVYKDVHMPRKEFLYIFKLKQPLHNPS